MKKDVLKVYILEILLIIVFFFALFVQNIFTNIILSILVVIYAIVSCKSLKKRNIESIYKKQVVILMIAFSAIYLIVFYLIGLYFGYYKSTVQFSIWSVFNYIIPLTAIIISSEYIRNTFLAQKVKGTKIITTLSMILLDLIIYAGVYDVTKMNDFLTVVGFILFASISCNLLYNYINVRYGKIPIIVYRLVTILYVYFIPITPNVFVFFRSFLRMLYPYVIYLVLEYTYSKSNFAVAYKDKRKNIISTTISGILLISLVMLISCEFKYGALVIGSGSMTGSLNKGDAIIYEQYENQNIQEGDIIVFKEKGLQVIHRVVDIKNVNGEYRYFTKGDANQTLDEGYRTKKDITGITKLRVLYIGYPTIWLRDIFS